MTGVGDVSSEMEEEEERRVLEGKPKRGKERGYSQLEGASSEEDLLVSSSSKFVPVSRPPTFLLQPPFNSKTAASVARVL